MRFRGPADYETVALRERTRRQRLRILCSACGVEVTTMRQRDVNASELTAKALANQALRRHRKDSGCAAPEWRWERVEDHGPASAPVHEENPDR